MVGLLGAAGAFVLGVMDGKGFALFCCGGGGGGE